MKYLLDTDHISVLQQGTGRDFASLWFRLSSHPRDDLALSIISFHEQMLGCHTYLSRTRSPQDSLRGYAMLQRLLADYSAAVVLPFDEQASSQFDAWQGARIRVGSMDLRIAAIAATNGLTLLTRNAKDFRQIPGLAIEDWTAN